MWDTKELQSNCIEESLEIALHRYVTIEDRKLHQFIPMSIMQSEINASAGVVLDNIRVVFID